VFGLARYTLCENISCLAKKLTEIMVKNIKPNLTFYQELEVMTRNMTRNAQEHDKTC
jgi:hypothetical protein